MQLKYLTLSILILLLFFIVCCASVNNKSTTTKGITSDNVITHDGYARKYITYQPDNLDKNISVPLLLVLHGGGSTNNQIIRSTHKRFNELADKHKFYVVYPQGLEKSWNDGRQDLKNFASQNKINDVDFIRKLIHKLQSEHKVDSNKVFVTGISNGGFMSFRLGCELREDIRAIAPITATITEDALKYCRGKSKVSLVLFNGTDDHLVPYNGGYVKVFGKKRGKITSTQYTINLWVDMLSCHDLPNKQELPDIKNDETTVTKFEYRQCKNNDAITLYRINGGGHTWPGVHNI